MKRQDGAALAVTFFILLGVMVIGVSAAQTALRAEQAARAERDRAIALASAEAALADAEHDIEASVGPRAAYFAEGSVLGFVPGCGAPRDPNAGLCAHLPDAPAWQQLDLADDSDAARAVPYGAFTGAGMPVGAGGQPARLPRYLIERVPTERAGDDAGARRGDSFRITAIGFGSRPATQVVLQSFYRKAAP